MEKIHTMQHTEKRDPREQSFFYALFPSLVPATALHVKGPLSALLAMLVCCVSRLALPACLTWNDTRGGWSRPEVFARLPLPLPCLSEIALLSTGDTAQRDSCWGEMV